MQIGSTSDVRRSHRVPADVQRRTLWLLVAASTLCYLAIGCYVAVLPGYILDHLELSTAAVGSRWARPASSRSRCGRSAAPGATVTGAARWRWSATFVLAAGSAILLGPGRADPRRPRARLLIGAGDAFFTTAAMAWASTSPRPSGAAGRWRRWGCPSGWAWRWDRSGRCSPASTAATTRSGGRGTGLALLAAVLVWMVGPIAAARPARRPASRHFHIPARRDPAGAGDGPDLLTATGSSRPSGSST